MQLKIHLGGPLRSLFSPKYPPPAYNYHHCHCICNHTLVSSIHDSTEDGVRKMIESSQRMIMRNSQGKGGGINPAIKKHLELQIKTLQNAHRRDVDKLRQLLQEKEREKRHETIKPHQRCIWRRRDE